MIDIFQVEIVERNNAWIDYDNDENKILFFKTYTNAKRYIDKIITESENEKESFSGTYWKMKRKTGKIIHIYLTYENFQDND
jgi:hypothetical protein